MHIHDFHSKLTSGSEESHLFTALRNLSRIEDPQHMLDNGFDDGEWPQWPSMNAHTSGAASAEV